MSAIASRLFSVSAALTACKYSNFCASGAVWIPGSDRPVKVLGVASHDICTMRSLIASLKSYLLCSMSAVFSAYAMPISWASL